jgi:predicted DNA-binding protein
MEVTFAPELEKQLNDLAARSGRGAAELVRDAVAGYMAELNATREQLNSRYDDVKSGRVALMDGEEAFARLRANIEERRGRPA